MADVDERSLTSSIQAKPSKRRPSPHESEARRTLSSTSYSTQFSSQTESPPLLEPKHQSIYKTSPYLSSGGNHQLFSHRITASPSRPPRQWRPLKTTTPLPHPPPLPPPEQTVTPLSHPTPSPRHHRLMPHIIPRRIHRLTRVIVLPRRLAKMPLHTNTGRQTLISVSLRWTLLERRRVWGV